jgi:putative transposase
VPIADAQDARDDALRNISQKWTMPIRDWKAAMIRFTIQFEERMTQH